MSDPQPKPLITQIMDELERRLQRVTVSNGYCTDAGLCVIRGRSQFNALINPETQRTYDRFPLLAISEVSVALVEQAPNHNSAGIPVRPYRATLGFSVIGANLIMGDIPQSLADQLWQDIITAVRLDPPIEACKAITPGDAVFDEVEIGAAAVTVRQAYAIEIVTNYGHVPTT